MYKKTATNYVVAVKNYQQIRGKNLTFLWKNPCNYQQNGKHTGLRGNLMNPVVSMVQSVSVKKPYRDTW